MVKVLTSILTSQTPNGNILSTIICKIKTRQQFSLEWNDTEIEYTTIISLIYFKKKTLLDFQNPTII